MGSAASHPNCSDLQLTNDGMTSSHPYMCQQSKWEEVIPLTPIVEKIEGLVHLQGDVYNFSRKYISDRTGGVYYKSPERTQLKHRESKT